MARGRSKLTDKEEKILVQAQLMGLSTASMVRIGNRLRAIDKERIEKAAVDDYTSGFSWAPMLDEAKNNKQIGWAVTAPSGHIFEFTERCWAKPTYYERRFSYTVTIRKPGTRFKMRVYSDVITSIHNDWLARLCPEGSKELYAMIRWARAFNLQGD